MRREFIITIGDREHEVTVEPDAPGTWRVGLGGREQVVDARRVRPGTWSLLIDGASHLVDLDPQKRGTSILNGMVEALAEVEDARQKRLADAVRQAGGATTQGERIRAPIAGKVVKLAVELGDVVEVGQSVVVLEAMKMENEIKAERGGVVEQVHVGAGQSVETQDVLVTLGPAQAE
ncbi:biotin/lipoyl-containing protein [Haliangium sp.]|uniref:biotin/lipoyl-containing protein n=1 Tax=Haliangium sp. TaxID=2663208 RepID=UPI003D0AC82A